MRQYQLTEPYLQYPQGQIFVGPLPILGQSASGYYPKGTESTAPGTECLFASAIKSMTDLFKEIQND